jgi:ABC-type multidrug transport system fused ATPase/permease subunit
MEINPGKITALVGESGSGKSTVFNLLLRFYHVDSGLILFDNTLIEDLNLQDLRSQFAYVSQDPAIFSATVKENLLYGKPHATTKEIEKALELASALEFVKHLPKGIDTYLGTKGVQISTGQKQRLAIARAFLKNPKILLLDEATSALDSINEKAVQHAYHKLMNNRTTIVIAHRLSTIRNADQIIVLRNGEVVENGNHDQLIQQNGEYYRLAKIQLKSANL